MKKRENTFLKLDWPFKALGKGIKKVAVGTLNFFNSCEIDELYEELDRSMGRMAESLENIKKSTEILREHTSVLTARKQAEQSPENAFNELVNKNRKLKIIVIDNRHRAYLQNRTWQNRLN